jgi:alkylhydroperoxidase/carboxymuconolactone decarboxylase family protein YurZ
MDPTLSHPGHEARHARREHLDALIRESGMKVPPAMKAVAQEVFGPGALGKKQKELTALAIAVATNCWE